MTGAMQNALDEIRGDMPFPTARHKTALYLAVECWGRELDEQPDWGRASLAVRIKDRWKSDLSDDGYSFVVATFLLITVLAAAISWAVQRLLDWLYPKNRIHVARRERLCCIKGQS